MSGLQFTWKKEGSRNNTTPLLKISNLAVRVGIRQVIQNLNLEVFRGDHILITGSNGCGKSTLLNAIAGVPLARIEKGLIELDGRDITQLPAHDRITVGIAYMCQTENVFPGLSVKENLVLALGENGPERFKNTFADGAESLPLGKHAGQLSGGQKKKLAWGMTTLRDNISLFLLDEPRAGVDRGACCFNEFCLAISSLIEIEHR